MRKMFFMAAIGTGILFGAEGVFGMGMHAGFMSKCAMCHNPIPRYGVKPIAPPPDAVMFHVKQAYPQKEEAVVFMVDYIMHPTEEKALCPSIKKFGTMPSQKKNLSRGEAREIVRWMYDFFPRKGWKHPGGIEGKFQAADRNNDQKISLEEFRVFKQSHGRKMSDEKIKEAFTIGDRNRDGGIDLEEMRELRVKMKNLRRGPTVYSEKK